MSTSSDEGPCRDARRGEVAEWILKAENDLQIAEELASKQSQAYNDGIAFHCQQSIEKLMKAVLISKGVVPPRVHDLPELLRVLEAAGVDWQWPASELRSLTMAAVHARYPGFRVASEQAAINLATTRAIWNSIRPRVI